MFTYPICSRGGFFQTSEYVLVSHTTVFPDKFHYINVDFNNNNFSTVGSYVHTANYTTPSITTDGTTVLHNNGASSMKQYAWNGTAFTEVSDVNLAGVNSSKMDLVTPDGYMIQVGVGSSAAYNGITQIPTSSPWTWGTSYTSTTASTCGGAFDVCRDDELGTPQVGSLFVEIPRNSGHAIYTFEHTTTDFTYLNNIAANVAGYNSFGVDRYNGKLYYAKDTLFHAWSINQNTGALSYDGTDTLGDAHGVTGTKGFVVIFEHVGTDEVLTTYTQSGGTLTQVDRRVLWSGGAAGSNPSIWTSPWTGNVYCGGFSSGFACSIADDGTIGPRIDLSSMSQNSTGAGIPFAFLKDPLPIIP